jgi:predicted lipoprotein with Yx(FWY)xxD motif
MKNMRALTALAAVAAISWASLATADEMKTAIQTAESSLGSVFVDGNGMTLYTFKNDTAGMSNCYDDCATNWPPLVASKGAEASGAFSLVERKDGAMQWALNGMPLYTFLNDKAAGDVNGQGVFDVWYVAKP